MLHSYFQTKRPKQIAKMIVEQIIWRAEGRKTLSWLLTLEKWLFLQDICHCLLVCKRGFGGFHIQLGLGKGRQGSAIKSTCSEVQITAAPADCSDMCFAESVMSFMSVHFQASKQYMHSLYGRRRLEPQHPCRLPCCPGNGKPLLS